MKRNFSVLYCSEMITTEIARSLFFFTVHNIMLFSEVLCRTPTYKTDNIIFTFTYYKLGSKKVRMLDKRKIWFRSLWLTVAILNQL